MNNLTNFYRDYLLRLFSLIIIFGLAYNKPLVAKEVKSSDTLKGVSGMVKISDSKYLLLYDSKLDDEARLTLMTLKKEKVLQFGKVVEKTVFLYKNLNIDDWKGVIPQDMEALCQVPSINNEYLLFQSGYSYGKTGNIIHIKYDNGKVSVLKQYKLFKERKFYEDINIEAAVCKSDNKNKEKIKIIASNRSTKASLKAGFISGILDISKNSKKDYLFEGSEAIVPIKLKWKKGKIRKISDLYLDKNNIVWGSAAEDLGDNGPFSSVIYKVNKFDFIFKNNKKIKAKIKYRIDGVKVEAITESSSFIPNSSILYGTDDENFGGIIRGLLIKK